jgi:hypothetical protein
MYCPMYDNVLSYVLFDCVVLCIVMCVNVYYCHRVSTQLQLNISYHIRGPSLGVKRPEREVYYCLPSGTEVKNA